MKTRTGTESGPQYAGFFYLPSGEVTSVLLSLDSAAAAASASGRRFFDLAFPKVRAFRTDEFGKTRAFSKIIVRRPAGCTVFWGNNPLGSSLAAQKTIWTYVDGIEIDSTAWCPEDPAPPPPPSVPEP